ncbi:MAG: PqqD family protein [Solirubrobacterales bacterium]
MGWLARNPEVECTELADGAVVLNMETRLYYSLNQAGLELWNATDGANGPEQVAKRLTEAFEIDEQAALGAVSRFLPELERERLVLESAEGPVAPAPAADRPDGPPRAFEEPQLIKHDEPLHDVANTPFDPQLPLAE